MQKFWMRFEVFFCAFILVGMAGMNISGAATTKFTKPSAPTNLTAVGGVEIASLKWKAPTNNGGQKITSYRVQIVELQSFFVCNGSTTSCTVPIKNPNKPSAKPTPLWFSFTVAAINSIGTGPNSAASQPKVQVRFREFLDLSNKFAPPAPKPTPTPTPTPTPKISPSASPISTPTPKSSVPSTGITAFDGTYLGNTVISVYSGTSQTPALVTPIPITFVVTNGAGSGTAQEWTVSGQVVDAKGVASITATSATYGSISFEVNFGIDGATKVMGGVGSGSRTVVIPMLGELRIEYSFNVARQP